METRIKDLRTDRALSQERIAEAIGISQRKYSYLETVIRQWPDALLVRLARFYHTGVDYLLRIAGGPAPYPPGKRAEVRG